MYYNKNEIIYIINVYKYCYSINKILNIIFYIINWEKYYVEKAIRVLEKD